MLKQILSATLATIVSTPMFGASINLKDVTTFDVSILYPLPVTTQHLTPQSVSLMDGKAILPNIKSAIGVEGEKSTVVGIRLDPCFPDLSLPADQCKPVIRMVLQPVLSNSIRTVDSAFHIFYKLERSELDLVIRKIIDLRTKYGFHSIDQMNLDEAPLRIHPLLTNTSFAKEFKEIMLSHVSASRFFKVTSAIGLDGSLRWGFRGFDYENGTLKPMNIGGLKGSTTTGVNEVTFFFDQGDGLNSFAPEIAASDDISPIAGLANDAVGERAVMEKALLAAYRIENPAIHSPDSTDCASCHTAHQTRKKGADWENTMTQAAKFKSSQGITLQAFYDINVSYRNVRAFGYFDKYPTINQRVVNESVAIVEFLRK